MRRIAREGTHRVGIVHGMFVGLGTALSAATLFLPWSYLNSPTFAGYSPERPLLLVVGQRVDVLLVPGALLLLIGLGFPAAAKVGTALLATAWITTVAVAPLLPLLGGTTISDSRTGPGMVLLTLAVIAAGAGLWARPRARARSGLR